MAARDGLITATVELVRRHGVAGTGLAQIVSTSGRSRRTIYLNFPEGKAQLMEAAVRAVSTGSTAMLAALMERWPPADAITAFVDGWIGLLEGGGFRDGCPIIAAALGRDEAPDAADAAGQCFTGWVEVIAEGLRGHGTDAETAADLAVTIVAAVEGAIIMCQATGSADPLARVKNSLLRLLAIP